MIGKIVVKITSTVILNVHTHNMNSAHCICTFAEVAPQLLLPQPVPCAPDVVSNQHLNNVNVVYGVENESL